MIHMSSTGQSSGKPDFQAQHTHNAPNQPGLVLGTQGYLVLKNSDDMSVLDAWKCRGTWF